ncbi:hypothetical protein BRARA_J00465 [Brassica rapa]|uniref:Uncharacterized protein n=1 Tax=Brassica campestris TaxID=3711 RepID=A0A397XIA1_BRACM|nr:hypothetical protein BRARA_J00465 [Brassica rapa]
MIITITRMRTLITALASVADLIKEEIQWKIRPRGTRSITDHSINMLFSGNTKN